MAAHPFTYAVVAEEAARWYANLDDTPTSPQMGDASQYAVVDLSTTGPSDARLAVEVEVSGTWFAADQGWGYPLVGTGHLQTTVKLPFGWSADQVQGVRVAVAPASAAGAVVVDGLVLDHVADDGTITSSPPLVPTVVARTPTVAPVLSVAKYYAGSEHSGSGYLMVRVADALGLPLDGISTTITLPKGARTEGCASCRSITGTSGSQDPRYAGLVDFFYLTHLLTGGLPDGSTTSVTTEDRAVAPVVMSFALGWG